MKHNTKVVLKKSGFVFLISICLGFVFAQNGDNIIRKGFPNGLTMMTVQAQSNIIATDFYLRTGTIYENEFDAGSSQLIAAIIEQHCKAKLNTINNGSLSIEVLPENIIFHFTSTAADFAKVVAIFKQEILLLKISTEDVEMQCNQLMLQRKTVDSILANNQKIYSNLYGAIFPENASKILLYSYPKNFCNLDSATIASFHRKYFIPTYFTITVFGNIDAASAEKTVYAILDSQYLELFNSEQLYRVKDIKQVRYSTQHLQLIEKPISEMQLLFQNPSGRKDRNGAYCAYLFSQLLTAPTQNIKDYISRFPLLQNIQAEYDMHINYGLFTLKAKDTTALFLSLADQMHQFINGFTKGKIITNADLQFAKTNFAANVIQFKQDKKNYLAATAKYRLPFDNNLILSLSDSAATISLADMNKYLKKYFTDVVPAYFLQTDSAALKKSPSAEQWFYLDTFIAGTTFFYPKNIYTLSSADSLALFKVYRWMQLNKDVNVIVNGFSDVGEYEKIRDTMLLHFIDSTPAFRKVMPDVFFKKRYFRPELARAVFLVKYLTDKGIDKSRVSGSGMRLRNTNEEQPEKNRFATFYFYKVRPKEQEFRINSYGK